jgi:hypothetical protein
MKKRVFLILALVTVTAGVASAFAPGSQESVPRSGARDLPMPVAPKQAAAPIAPASGSAPVVNKASVEARHAPVPLLMKPRPPIEQHDFDADAVGPEVPAKFSDGSGESAAKAAIEADGYKGVKVVRQGANGIWYARALRGTTEVPLTVDAQGNVALE